MLVDQRVLSGMSGVVGSMVLFYKTPEKTYSYLNTINVTSADGPQGVPFEEFDNPEELQIKEEGLTLDDCYVLKFRSVSGSNEVILKTSALVPFYDVQKDRWVGAMDLQPGDSVLGGSGNYILTNKYTISPVVVYSYLDKKESDKITIRDIVVGTTLATGISIYVKPKEKEGGGINGEGLVIFSDVIKTMTNRTYLWDMPLNEGTEIYLTLGSKRIEIVAYGVEIDKTKMDSQYFGEFIRHQTVNDEVVVMEVPEKLSVVITNVIFSSMAKDNTVVSMKINSRFGTQTLVPSLDVKRGDSEDYRMGLQVLPNIQLAEGECMVVNASSPIRVTVYGHYQCVRN